MVEKAETMTIDINRLEIEALIQQRLHSGGFENVEDVLFDVLEIQREREAWRTKTKMPSTPRSSAALPTSIVAKAYRARKCAIVLKLTRRRGSRTVLNREVLRRCAGSRKRSSADLALPARGGGLAVANRIQVEPVDTFEELAEIPGKDHRRSDLTDLDVLFFSVY
jgi:hypothetical protein